MFSYLLTSHSVPVERRGLVRFGGESSSIKIKPQQLPRLHEDANFLMPYVVQAQLVLEISI